MLRRRLMMLTENLFWWLQIREKMSLGRKADGEAAKAEAIENTWGAGIGKLLKVRDHPAQDVPTVRGETIGRLLNGRNHQAQDAQMSRGGEMGRTLDASSDPTEALIVRRNIRVVQTDPVAYKVEIIIVRRAPKIARETNVDACMSKWGYPKRGMFIGGTTDGEASQGKWGYPKRGLRLKPDLNADDAPSECLKAKNGFDLGHKTAGDGYPSEPIKKGTYPKLILQSDADGFPAEAAKIATGTAQLSGIVSPKEADSQPGLAQHGLLFGRTARVVTWGDPTILEDGSLLIRQAYEAQMVEGELEVI